MAALVSFCLCRLLLLQREHLEPLYESSWRGGRIDDRYTHVVVASGSSDHFHDWYGPFTRLCPRYTSEMPDGLCFCAPEHATADGPRPALTDDARLPPSSGVVDAIVRNLGLEHVRPPRDRPALGMVSREHKRFILNELELARIAVEQGVSFKLLPLEYMTVYEQVREFRRLHWLVGIHGSGLINVLFLHTQQSASDAGASHQPGLPPLPPNQSHLSGDAAIAARVMLKQSFRQYCLQVMPYAVRIGGEFFRPMAQQVGCQYEEWLQPKRSNTVIHTHFLGANEFRNLDALMQRVRRRDRQRHEQQQRVACDPTFLCLCLTPPSLLPSLLPSSPSTTGSSLAGWSVLLLLDQPGHDHRSGRLARAVATHDRGLEAFALIIGLLAMPHKTLNSF